MPSVLTVASAVTCPHQASVATSGTSKLTVSGSAALLAAGIAGQTVSACPISDSSSTTKCRTVLSVTGGLATKLTVGGAPVVLESLIGVTDGVSPAGNALVAQANQTRLTAS
jgi:hypothetical protein